MDGYNRNIFSLPKHQIRINRAFATLVRPIVRNTGCDPLFFTTSVGVKDRDNTKSKTEICENEAVCIVSGEGEEYVGDRCAWDTRIRLYVL